MQIQTNTKRNIIRKINIIVSITLSIICFGLFIYTLITGDDPYNRLLGYLGVGILFVLPILFEVIFKRRLSNTIYTFINIFLFFFTFVGVVLLFYGYVPFYDKAMHSLFGYIGCILGLLIVCKLAKYEELNPIFIAIVCFSVSLMCGAVWEIFEYMCDSFLGQNMQGDLLTTIDGEQIRTITDTMRDIICNFVGALVFIIHYILHIKSKKNLYLGNIINDFSNIPLAKKK